MKIDEHQTPPGAPARTVLVLQGGGALGAYQAGVYETLAASDHKVEWVAGISIGAINAALIAGNPPARRVERLREFWETVSSNLLAAPAFPGEQARAWFNDTSSTLAAQFGLPGFFKPRLPPAFVYPPGSPQALSVYDTAELRTTLEALVDFDLINTARIRLSVGAVNVRTGNFVYFDNLRQTLGPEHIMASGALPPGFPPVEIDGELYWDGGLVSNTPLQYVLDEVPRPDMLIFQVDLFSARGDVPRSLGDVAERQKDIRFSSRTRLNTDVFRQQQTLRRAAFRLLQKLPPELKSDRDAELLDQLSCDAAITIVHLINRRKNYSTQAKDFEFSRHSMQENWASGAADLRRTLRHPLCQTSARPSHGVTVLDLTDDD